MPLSGETLEKASELIARYPKPRSALLPLLFLVQAEDGYVSPTGVAQVAGLLGITKAEVGAVATFYTMFHRRPVGKYVVNVCRTLPCEMAGSDEMVERLCSRLGIPVKGTTPDGMITIEEVECLAACDGAPVLQVNNENYERLSAKEAVDLVEALLLDEVPPPTFAAEGSVTEPTSWALFWRLAGLGDPPARLLTRRPRPVGDADGAFPQQDVAPGRAQDPTLRPVEDLRAGADHSGGPLAEAGQGARTAPDALPSTGLGAEPLPQDAQATSADVPAPADAEPQPGRGGHPGGAMSEDANVEAGHHEREQPGGDAL